MSQLCWGDDQHCLVTLTPGRFMNSQRFCDFLKDRIIVTGQWQNMKIAPLVVVHLLSQGFGPTFTLHGAKGKDEQSKRELGELRQLHKEYQENDKVLVVAMGDDTEVVLVPINGSNADEDEEMTEAASDEALPRFWGYTLIRGALGDGADLLDSGRLPVILDLDETLVLAHTQSSLANRISVLNDDRTSVEGKTKATENEKQGMEKDWSLLKSFTENNRIVVDGKEIHAEYEFAEGEDGKVLQRPIIRLTDNCFFTRIDPDRLETSMLIRIRPGWNDLRKYLSGEGPTDKKQRFKVSVCTAAERGYALEAWRLLDPARDIIPLEQVDHRLICMGKQKKSLFRALHLGPWSKALVPQGCLCQATNIGPLVEGASEMPLAIIIDDRMDVWEPRNHSQLVKVRPFLHYRDSVWPHRLPTDNDAAELQKVQGLLQSARSNLYYELQEVLTPFIHKGYKAGLWDEASEDALLKSLERVSSLQSFLEQNYSRLPAPSLPASWLIDLEPDISLCPQDPRDLAATRQADKPKTESASVQAYKLSSGVISSIPQRCDQDNFRKSQSVQPSAKYMAAKPPESYQCSMQPQDPRREWKAKMENSNKPQGQLGPQTSMSALVGGGIPQKRKYDQVENISEAEPGLNIQGKVDGANLQAPMVIDLVKGQSIEQSRQPRVETRPADPQTGPSLIQGNWMSQGGLQGQMKGLTGRMGNFKMDAANIAAPLPSLMGQMVAAPHQFANALSVQSTFQQSIPAGNGLQIQLGRGLGGVGQVLTSQEAPAGVHVFRQDGKGVKHAPVQSALNKKFSQEQMGNTYPNSKRPRPSRGRKQVQHGPNHVQERNQATFRPMISGIRIQNAPGSVHPLTVQQISGHPGQPNSVLVQGVIGQMGIPQQSAPSQLKLAQVRVPASSGLAQAPQNSIPSFVVIKPQDQQQPPNTLQIQQFSKGLQQSIIAQPTGWQTQATLMANHQPSPFFSSTQPGGMKQEYSLPQQGHPPPPQGPPPQSNSSSLQQNQSLSGMRGRGLRSQPNLMENTNNARGEMPRQQYNSSSAAPGRGATGTGSMPARLQRYTDGPAQFPAGDLNPISQLNQFAQKEKADILFGAREQKNGYWTVTVSCKGVVKGVAVCRNKRLGKRMASLLALEKLGAIRPREFDHRWRILSSEEDLMDEDKWTPCELLEGLYPGRVVYSDIADGPDRTRSFKAEVSVTTDEGESLRCDIDAGGMSKKKARNALANKMLRIRKLDPMMVDEDANTTGRSSFAGNDDRATKQAKMMPKQELERKGYLAQLEDALDDEETEEGEIQE